MTEKISIKDVRKVLPIMTLLLSRGPRCLRMILRPSLLYPKSDPDLRYQVFEKGKTFFETNDLKEAIREFNKPQGKE